MGKSHPSLTFEAARAAWLADARFRRLSPVTIREYARVSNALLGHLSAELGRAPQLDDLRPVLVRAWLNDRRPPLKPASAAAYVRSLRAFGRWCGREYRIADPLAGLRPPRVEPTPVPLFAPQLADALLIATPEYNNGMPGVLKNTIDWASRPAAASVLRDKPVVVMGVSPGAGAAARAQQQVRDAVVYTGGCVLPEPELLVSAAIGKFDDDGNVTDPELRAQVVNMVTALRDWAEPIRMPEAQAA